MPASPRFCFPSSLLLALCLPLLHGCSGCYDVGCSDGVTLTFQEPLTLGESVTITVELPNDLVSCSGSGDSIYCPDLSLTTYNGHTSIRLDGRTPRSARVIIESDGDVIADRTASNIRYDDFSPNGDSCPPTCSGGKATL